MKRFLLAALACFCWRCGDDSTSTNLGTVPGTPEPVAAQQSTVLQPPSGLISTRFVTHDPGFNDYRPTFSPDAGEIVFERNTVGNTTVKLHKVSASGGTVSFLLSNFGESSTRPDWSAATNRIAFAAESGGNGTLWICDPDGGNLTKVSSPRFRSQISYPHWFPDGKSVAVSDYGNGGSLASEKGIIRKVTVPPDPVVVTDLTDPGQLLAGDSAVSPDGRWLALAAQAEVNAPYNQDTNNIFVVDLQDSKAAPILLDRGQGRAPAWSPDGTAIIFESNRTSSGGQYVILAKRFSGQASDVDGPVLQLTPDALDAQHAEFSRSGGQIVLTALQGGANSPRGILILELASALQNF